MVRSTVTLAAAAALLAPPPSQVFLAASDSVSSSNNVGVDNMNGNYILSETPGGNANRLFPKRYADYPKPPSYSDGSTGGGTDFFDVYSPPITTLYSQVFWKGLEPVPLPEHIVKAFEGKGMAVVGFEMDQVRTLDNGKEESVPINVAYNHHFESTMIGGDAKFVKVYPPFDDKQHEDGSSSGHGHPQNQPRYVVVDESLTSTGLPHKQDFGAANGGEYRKSFHGYAPGYAQVIESPKQIQITPMQIDTWHRDKMNLTDPHMKFVAGPLPKNSLAPVDGTATYSGLLECPITTRIRKVVKGGYVPLLHGQCSDDPSMGDIIESAQECFGAAEETFNGGKDVKFETLEGADSTKPPGCSATVSSNGKVIKVFYNDIKSGDAASCGAAGTTDETYAGSASSLVNVTLLLDPAKDLATLTLVGPSDVWFGIGFGAQAMKDSPWAVIVDGQGSVTERKLGDQNPGTELAPSLKVVNATISGKTRTIVATRTLKGPTTDYYTFRTNVTLIPFINAIGSTPDLSYHKAREPATLPMLPVQDGNDDDAHQHADNVAGVCLCSSGPIPFGSARGTLEYIPVPNQPGEAGSGKVSFGNYCPTQPRSDLLHMHNPTCDIRTYTGGQTACHHMWSLLDADQPIPWPDRPITYKLKFRFWIQTYDPSYHTAVRRTTWGIASPVEYDVPKCSDTVEGCTKRKKEANYREYGGEEEERWVHTIRGTFQPTRNKQSLKLAAAHFHCHAPTCLSVELYMCDRTVPVCNATTGTLLCREDPIYGGTDQIDVHKFDEEGYIAQPPCLWGSKNYGLEEPVDVGYGKMLHCVKTSDATSGHHGEMAWLQILYF